MQSVDFFVSFVDKMQFFIELSESQDKTLAKSLKLNGMLQQAFGLQKIDIIIHTKSGRALIGTYVCLLIVRDYHC